MRVYRGPNSALRLVSVQQMHRHTQGLGTESVVAATLGKEAGGSWAGELQWTVGRSREGLNSVMQGQTRGEGGWLDARRGNGKGLSAEWTQN